MNPPLDPDYPVVRASTTCPLCGHPKDVGTLFCWRCYRGGKSIPDFGKVALDRFENHPGRIADFHDQRSYK